MKPVFLILALVVALMLIGCASQQYVPKDDEELYGTWLNTDYSGVPHTYYCQKIVYSFGGGFGAYSFAKDVSTYPGKFTIVDKWTDSHGNIWYKVSFSITNKAYAGDALIKISNNVTVLQTFHYSSIPPRFLTKMDKDDPIGYYRIYYRQK